MRSRWKVNQFFEAYDRVVNHIFSAYGSYVAHKPLLPICVGIILLGSFTFGLFKYEKETDLEKLWVEHGSRVVEEKKFFDTRFGGVSRQEFVALVRRDNEDAQIPLAEAFDALEYSVAPLFDNLTWEYTYQDGKKTANLTQVDFCETLPVPPSLQPGTNPLVDGNWVSYGYQFLSTCSLAATMAAQTPPITNYTTLPVGWGIEKFPCTKLVPMDCFHEGGDFDYPIALQQLETVEPAITVTVAGGGTEQVVLTLVDITTQFQQQSNSCITALTNNITSFVSLGLPAAEVQKIVNGVVGQVGIFYTYGYRWRQSYKGMSDQQIIDHINSGLKLAEAWSPDPTNIQAPSCVTDRLPCCLTWFGVHTPIESALGSVTRDPQSGNITKIGGIRWTQNNYNQNHRLWRQFITAKLQANFTDAEFKSLQTGWESQMINQLLPLRNREDNNLYAGNNTYSNLRLEFLTWRATEDIISDSSKTPIWQIILSVVLTSIYAYLAFANFSNPVHSFTWLVLTGLTIVTLAILSGFGFTALVGIKFSPLAGGVVPFLTLALGVDDVFVLSNTLRNHLADPRLQAMGEGSVIPEREMRLTLALAGPSVILTTVSVLAAFFISSLNPLPMAQWFCWQMGITATLHTIGLILIFMPVMAIDARRCKAEINDPNFWLVKGFRRKSARSVSETPGSAKLDRTTKFDDLDPSLLEHTGSTRLSRLVAKYYAPLFESNLFKIGVVLFSIGLLVSMAYLGFKKVDHGLNLSDATKSGSYQNTFAKLTEQKFLDYSVYVVTREIDYPNSQTSLLEIYSALNASKWAGKVPTILESSWLGNYLLFANLSVQAPDPVPASIFYPLFDQWTTNLGILSLQDLYCIDRVSKEPVSCFDVTSNPNVTIGATKAMMIAENLGAETNSNLDMIRGTRRIVDALNDKFGEKVAYMYGYPFLFFEQYLHSYHDLYLVVGLAVVGVFVSTLVFQQSIIISLLICVLLFITDIEVYGFLYILHAKLNALSLVNLGIVIGMLAEFTYLARSFLLVEGTRNHRVAKAIEWTLEPLLHGFGVQFAATFPLVFVKYHAFRLYYFEMFTIMGILSFFNGFFVLPSLLSWIGPDTLHHVKAASASAVAAAASEQEKWSSTEHEKLSRLKEQKMISSEAVGPEPDQNEDMAGHDVLNNS